MTNSFQHAQPAAALAARLLIAWIFIYDGVEAYVYYDAVSAYMEANGVPSSLLPLAIATEFFGGILIAVGLVTRLAALALAGFCLLTALLFHTGFADPNELIHFNKDLAIAGGFLALAAFGAGPWSLDGFLKRDKPQSRQRSGGLRCGQGVFLTGMGSVFASKIPFAMQQTGNDETSDPK